MKTQYIYLHGFASSPNSAKAQHIRERFSELNHSLIIPDLNQNNFSHLTLSRQIEQVSQLLRLDTSVTLLGSSFGGLTAAYLAEKHPQIERLVLLAPAFGFLSEWLNRLGTDMVKEWKNLGYLKVYHYGEMRSLPLHYDFAQDTEQYDEAQLQRQVPTLIIHGRNDEVIPIKYSRDYAKQRPWVKLIEVESDHSLTNVTSKIWSLTKEFCHL